MHIPKILPTDVHILEILPCAKCEASQGGCGVVEDRGVGFRVSREQVQANGGAGCGRVVAMRHGAVGVGCRVRGVPVGVTDGAG